MSIPPPLRHACAAVGCALAMGLGAQPDAWSQSLSQALVSTYNSNPDLLAGRALLRQTDESLAQAVANWRPKVSLSFSYGKLEYDISPVKAANTYSILNQKTTMLQVVQPVFRGGKTVADTKTAQANIQAQRAQLANTEETALLGAVTAYATLVQDLGIVDARRNNVRVLVEQLESTRERFRVGELTITDVSQAEARLEGGKADLILAEAQIRIDEASFVHIIGLRPGKLGELPLVGALPASEEEAVALAMDASPLPISAQFQISAALYGVQSANAALLPQINLTGYILQQQDFQVPGDFYNTYGAVLQATIPIYQNGSEWSTVRQAKELVGQRRNQLDSARRTAAENVIRAWRNLDAARARVTSFEAQVKANQVALDGVRQEALVGSRTTLDVLNAEQEVLTSEVSLLQARHDVQVNYYTVLAGIGRLTARTLALPVEYYDEEKYYKNVGSRWIGDWSSDPGSNK